MAALKVPIFCYCEAAMARDYSAFLPGGANAAAADRALPPLETPGMRELQLTDAASGIADVFEDIEVLSVQCRFGDCRHQTEPGCAVRAAVEEGRLDPARLARWRKLQAEDAFNSASLAERRTKDRAFGKMVRRVTQEKSRHQP